MQTTEMTFCHFLRLDVDKVLRSYENALVIIRKGGGAVPDVYRAFSTCGNSPCASACHTNAFFLYRQEGDSLQNYCYHSPVLGRGLNITSWEKKERVRQVVPLGIYF